MKNQLRPEFQGERNPFRVYELAVSTVIGSGLNPLGLSLTTNFVHRRDATLTSASGRAGLHPKCGSRGVMDTQVKSPHAIFNMPQRLLVPLFQRPYVWSLESQWAPLWRDVERVADRLLSPSAMSNQPHFLGAVVLQQLPNPVGAFQVRTIIDGQQRLTTLQVMLDAFQAEMLRVDAKRPAARLLKLVANDPEYCESGEDQFKVWPTNRDRPAFQEVMAAPTPVQYSSLTHSGERLQQAHKYFSEQSATWLQLNGPDEVQDRAEALEKTVRELLQLVVIDLGSDENAQEIFETLNSRGAQLSAADLIKNFVFQRLLEEGADTEGAYDLHWKHFETAFWETEDSVGRLRYPRSSMFLNSFLVSRLGEPVAAQEVFSQFKNYANHTCKVPMLDLLTQIHQSAIIYENFIKSAATSDSSISRLGLFAYRMNALDIDVIKAVVLVLLDPEEEPIEESEFHKALNVLESFLVRRMVVRATTKNHNRVLAQAIADLRKGNRRNAGTYLEKFFAGQTADSSYWPDDTEVAREVAILPIYRRLRRPRVRFLLEAIEDRLRGFTSDDADSKSEQRCPRGTLTIEHVIPQRWKDNWPLEPGENEQNRNQVVDCIGNLTLLTGKLNSANSNNAWLGEDGKLAALKKHSQLKLSGDIIEQGSAGWTVTDIDARTSSFINDFIAIWAVPPGHAVNAASAHPEQDPSKYVYFADLIEAGLIAPGDILLPVRARLAKRTATVLQDGSIELDTGERRRYPSGAAMALSKAQSEAGWHFWIHKPTKKLLNDLRSEYRDLFDESDVEIDDPTESHETQ